jgi:hypothetical protein
MRLDHPKRTNSAYEYVDPAIEFPTPEDWKHKTYSENRLSVDFNEAEKIYLDEWQKIASKTLAYILNEVSNEASFETISQRDIEVAATLMQWLGSPVGQGFVQECQKKNLSSLITA